MIAALLIATADVAAPNADADEIVVTASRVPANREETAASVSVVDNEQIERLGAPLVQDYLRLAPSLSVSSGGPAGTLTQVRIRGAEANHTLLFVDGIKANDLSYGDEPRFELLNADLASRIEVVRGPQSALWGSQAIGGVIAVDGGASDSTAFGAKAEAGSFGFGRASASASLVEGDGRFDAALGWQHANGIDMVGGGDRDGYRNLSGRARASWNVASDVTVGVNGFTLAGRSEFDGTDPFTFAPSQDLSTRFHLAAGRIWATLGRSAQGLGGSLSASIFSAHNRSLFKGDETSRTSGDRATVSGQANYGFATGEVRHTLVAAAEFENEKFKSRDTSYGGLSNQDEHRRHGAITGEWKASLSRFEADLAVRRDLFSKFRDATTVRASLLTKLGGGLSIAASYGEGIVPPTFTELYGFFPGSFVGNPDLKPEKSRGVEGSLRYDRGAVHAAVTAYRQRLTSEIATIFVPPTFEATTINRDGSSHRWGIEGEASWKLSDALRLGATYAYLKANEPAESGGRLREIRRPRNSGSLFADGATDRFNYGISLAYVGSRDDTDFDVFPAATVRLKSYVLANARAGFAPTKGVELFVRGSNLFDKRYQDVLGYRTEGRAVFAGVSFRQAPSRTE